MTRRRLGATVVAGFAVGSVSAPREVVGKIRYLRQTYHFGPRRIADYLRRFTTCRWRAQRPGQQIIACGRPQNQNRHAGFATDRTENNGTW